MPEFGHGKPSESNLDAQITRRQGGSQVIFEMSAAFPGSFFFSSVP